MDQKYKNKIYKNDYINERARWFYFNNIQHQKYLFTHTNSLTGIHLFLINSFIQIRKKKILKTSFFLHFLQKKTGKYDQRTSICCVSYIRMLFSKWNILANVNLIHFGGR